MEQSLELRIANESVRDFHEEIMREHHAAMACCDCEERLQKGIVAYRWLSNAEATVREGIVRGFLEGEKATEALEAAYLLYQTWLYPCETAWKWVELLQLEGYTPDNLEEFRECADQVAAWVEEHQWREKTRVARSRRFAAEPF